VAASKSTVERVLEVILKHVPKETALKILEELMTVPRQQVVPRYHRADVQPCASTMIATIPSEATRGTRAVRDGPKRNTADGEEATRGCGGGTRIQDLARKPACRSLRRFQEAWRRLRPRANSTRCMKRPPDLAHRISLDANPCVNRFNQRHLGKSSAMPPGSSTGTR